MQFVKLTKGFEAIVSDEDFEIISRFNWYADVNQWTVYAKNDLIQGRPRMHTFIMKPEQGFITHHMDNNGLNNQRTNLENITQAEHARKSKLRRNKMGSLYRGVSQRPSGRFTAEIWRDYKKFYLGDFDTEQEAAIAYIKASHKLNLGEAL